MDTDVGRKGLPGWNTVSSGLFYGLLLTPVLFDDVFMDDQRRVHN